MLELILVWGGLVGILVIALLLYYYKYRRPKATKHTEKGKTL